MNNPFEYNPDALCSEGFAELMHMIDELRTSDDHADINFVSELDAGKMLGVLIAADTHGDMHTLFAFSGQIGDNGFYHKGFVGPVFDYLQPDGYFKTHESDISRQNVEIAQFKRAIYNPLLKEYNTRTKEREAKIDAYREQCRKSKAKHSARRSSGDVSEEELADMIRQSQFEKAEMRRLKQRTADSLAPLQDKLNEAKQTLDEMKERRRADSEALQQWLFDNFKLMNGMGEERSVGEIFADTPMKTPPSGAGECCAPKLLQTAYLNGWKPISIAEYWHGKPKEGEVRRHGEHYPACRGKCLPILQWMLKGIDISPPLDYEKYYGQTFIPKILYENQWFCVIEKPSGMLSVPGKGESESLQQWLDRRYGVEREVKMVHRLDQDTSGLVIASFGNIAHKVLQSLFANRRVHKTYIADLEGDWQALGKSERGRIELPLSPDWLDRPRQRVDLTEGKPAVTDYKFISTSEGISRVEFHPLTGRTHQLRVHAAAESGLGMPIAGDRLYGKDLGHAHERLHLHAYKINFHFPIDGKDYSFSTDIPEF